MPSITTAVNRLLWLTSRHLGGGGDGTSLPLVSACHRERYSGSESVTPTARPLIKASSRPCLLCLTGNGFQCEQSTNPHRPAARAASSRPLPGGGQCMTIAPDTVHGEQELDFGEGDRVYGREVACFRGSASMGNRPRGGGGSPGRGVEHPPPLSRRVTGNGFRGAPLPLSPASLVERLSPDQPPPPSPTSPQCRLAKNRTMPL